QAEDGIRDFHVTGVQTCALPICQDRNEIFLLPEVFLLLSLVLQYLHDPFQEAITHHILASASFLSIYLAKQYPMHDLNVAFLLRSEERRVGIACRFRWSCDWVTI